MSVGLSAASSSTETSPSACIWRSCSALSTWLPSSVTQGNGASAPQGGSSLGQPPRESHARVVGEPVLEPEVRRHRAAALLALGRAREALAVVEPVTSAGHLRAYARLLLGEPQAALDEAFRHLRSGRRTSLATTACLTSTLVAWEAYLADPACAERARAVLELYEKIPGRVPVSLAWLACLRWECGARAEALAALRALEAAGAAPPPVLLSSLDQQRPDAQAQLQRWARSMVALNSEHALPGRPPR